MTAELRADLRAEQRRGEEEERRGQRLTVTEQRECCKTDSR